MEEKKIVFFSYPDALTCECLGVQTTSKSVGVTVTPATPRRPGSEAP